MNEVPDHREDGAPVHALSRRAFLRGSGAAAAAAGSIASATLGVHSAVAQDASPAATPAMPGMNMTGATGAANAPVKFFTNAESKTADAIVSRIMPGSADDPGAHEAGVVTYIDNKLYGTNLGYDLKT